MLRCWIGLFGCVVLVAAQSQPARSADCPPGRIVDHIEKTETETETKTQTFCKCAPGHIPRGQVCVDKLPEIDPAFFFSSDHAAFVRSELERLKAKRARLVLQLTRLERLRSDQNRYLQEMGEMRERVLYDGLSDLFSIMASDAVLRQIPGLSPTDESEIAGVARLLKTSIDAAAVEEAGPDRDRARRKALDASKTALGAIAKLTIPDNYKDVLKKVVDASFETVKAADQNWRAVNQPLGDRVAKALDGFAAITGAVVPPIGAARSAINVAGGAIVYWHIQNDKESIVETLVSSQRAKLAYDNRLVATEEMIKFYEVELGKAGN